MYADIPPLICAQGAIYDIYDIHASTTDVHLQVSEDGETLQPFIICVGVTFSFIK